LLALSELEPTERIATTILQTLAVPTNARDPWIPDAIAVAGAKQGPGLLTRLLASRQPEDSLAVAGFQRAISKMARYHAGQRDAGTVVGFIATVPSTPLPFAVAMLNGIADGWPEEQPPALSEVQRTALRTAAQGAPAELLAGFGKVAARWGMPDLFTPR
jgi:hypothetical protein